MYADDLLLMASDKNTLEKENHNLKTEFKNRRFSLNTKCNNTKNVGILDTGAWVR